MTWQSTPLGRLYRLRDQRAGSLATHLPLMSVSQYQGVVPRAGLMGDDGRAESLDNYKLCEPGDLVLNRMSAYNGALGVARERGLVSPDYLVMEPTGAALAEFLARWLKTPLGVGEMTKRLRGIGGPDASQVRTPRVNHQELRDIAIPLPPLPEQRAIVNFLDRETAKIDALTAEQQGLVEVLRERRSAAIARATGWGGTTPEGWSWQRISWLFNSTGSGTTPAPEDIVEPSDETVPWVTTGELRELPILSTRKAVPVEALASYSALKVHPAGSLAIAMYGATIGRLGMLAIPATTNQACCVMSAPRRCLPRFVQYSLMAARPWLLLEAAGGGQPNINQDKVRSFRIPTPKFDEQRRIADRLDEQTKKIDALIAEAEGIVAVAKERRAALITAAVTGRIDVRGEVA